MSGAPGPTRAVVLDLDDTLVVEESGALAALGEVAGRLLGRPPRPEDTTVVLEAIRGVWQEGPAYRLAVELGIASWEALWASFEGSHPVLDELCAWLPTYRRRAWSAALVVLGVDAALAGEAAAAYVALQRAPRPLVEGAHALVSRLAGAGVPLGLLTNGPVDIQRRKLAQSGLEACFSAVVISGELGVGKPLSAAFAAVLEHLGVAPGAAVMVGDSWGRDVLGALGAGMRAVWVSHGRPVPTGRAGAREEAVSVAGGLAEVLTVLMGSLPEGR